MSRTPRRLAAAAVVLALVPLPAVLTRGAAAVPVIDPEVPRAVCSPGDRPESPLALQGQVPVPDRQAGFAGTSCNLSLLGSVPGPGGTYVGAAYRDCAYSTTNGKGVQVVDLADPTKPVVTATLTTPAMMRTWESLKVHEGRRLMAATGYGGDAFDVYDVSDCRKPVLLSSTRITGTQGHEGEWSPDGRTYYITNRQHTSIGNFGFLPVDLTDPTAPRPLKRWDTPGRGQAHGLSLNADGTRMYLSVPDGFIGAKRQAGSGMLVLDVSQVQARAVDPQVRIVSDVRWLDGGEAQMSIPVTIGGKPHLISVDEWGSYSLDFGRLGCAGAPTGTAPYGYPRIFDISDETAPRLVRTVRLQTQTPENCALVVNDATHLFSYSTHYCSVDRVVEPRLLGCGTFESGLRIFDITKITAPREVAYWNPAPRAGTTSEVATVGLGVRLGDTDWSSSPPVFRLDRGEIWVQTQMNGIQALRLAPSAHPKAA